MKTTPNHGLSYVEGNDRPADYPLISQENMTKLDTLIQQLIDGKAPLSHNHSIGQIMGLTEALDSKADQQATAAALAGKAPTSHTHTMDDITGLTAALAAKANQAALDTRVPSTLALRLDTTVGTRIFAGATVIYGDTGWRDVSSSLLAGFTGKAFIRRKDNTTYIRLSDIITPGATTETNTLDIPTGFRHDQTRILHHLGPTDTQNGNVMINSSLWFLRVANTAPGKMCGYTMEFSYQCTSTWPATLPGLPA